MHTGTINITIGFSDKNISWIKSRKIFESNNRSEIWSWYLAGWEEGEETGRKSPDFFFGYQFER